MPKGYEKGEPVTPRQEKEMVNRAQERIRLALDDAIAVKVANLKSPDLKIRDAAATFIIEQSLGKAKQTIENTGDEDTKLVASVVRAIQEAQDKALPPPTEEIHGYTDEGGTFVIDQRIYED